MNQLQDHLIKQNYRLKLNQMMATLQLSVLNPQHCHQDSLIHKEHHKDYDLWYDPIDKRQYCEYKLYGWPNQKQIENYQFRKDQRSNLVYVHYLANLQNAGFKQCQVFVERIPLLLSSVQKLTFIQALSILKECLIGFQALFRKFGYVHIDDKLIGFTPEGEIRVWMNETFAYNGVAQTHMAPKWMNQNFKSRQMICIIFAIIEDRLQKNRKEIQFKRQRQAKLVNISFDNAIQFINYYTEKNQIKIFRALPELLVEKISDVRKKTYIKNQQKITKPLMFKKVSGSPKRKIETKINITVTLVKDEEKEKGVGMCRIQEAGSSFLSPCPSVRPRNQSEAAISVAESRAKTCQTIIKFKRSTIKYFYDKQHDFVNQNGGTLQSSLISKDQELRSNNHFRFQATKNKVFQFQFNVNNHQNTKPNKKRKFSGADCMTFYASSAPQRGSTSNNKVALARSMVIKNKLQNSNRIDRNPESKVEGLENLNPFFEMEQALASSNIQQDNPSSPARKTLQNHTAAYKADKPFLNYKPIKGSFISDAKVDLKDSLTDFEPPNLKNSFLKNADMKSSQIIMQRSSEYASIRDIMKTIRQSQVQTPMSEINAGGFSHYEKQMNLFTGNAEKQKTSEHNISNSTTDRKSSFYYEKKEGLLNFTSPKNTVRSGMFKSIIVDDSKQEGKEVVEGRQD